MVPARRPRQFGQPQFHCGKPPPAAEPRTRMSTLYPPEKRQPPARLAAERGAVPCRLDGRALEAVVLLPVEVILVGVDLRVHLDLDEIRRFPGHVVHLREGAQGQRLVGRYYPGARVSVNPIGAGRFDPSGAIWQDSARQLKEMGLTVPNLDDLYRSNASGAHYISHFPVQGMLFLSGTVPIKDGKPYLPGVVGESLTLEQGYEAARYAALTTLAAVKYALGDLDRVQQIVHLTGFVNSAPGFNDQPRVINGAADILVAIYGERGKPTRAAIGCRGLGGNASVEIIVQLLFSGTDVRPPLARDHFAP